MKKRIIYSFIMLLWSEVLMAVAIPEMPVWQQPALLKAEESNPCRVSVGKDWEGPLIYGTVYYTNDENVDAYGIYAVDAATGRMAAVNLEGHVNANGGGIYDNGLYRFVSFNEERNAAIYYEYRVSDWTFVKSEVLPDKSNLAFDEAYDPSTGNVYGCFSDEKAQRLLFGIIDHDTHQVTAINELDMAYFGVVATPDGIVYAIASDGNLYKIDKTTGARTFVGATGIMPKYNQTAVCDLHTGRVYWLACNTIGASGIYEIDLATGKASRINSFTRGNGFTGAIIAQMPYVNDAPDSVSDWAAVFDGASTAGTVSFTMPDKTVAGAELSGKINYNLMVGTKQYASGSAAPGQKVSIDVNHDEGLTQFTVLVSNEAGYGKPHRVMEYIGYDAPEAVSDLRTEVRNGNTAVLSWKAPARGQNGGFFDASGLSYKIIRNPGGTIISSGYKKTDIEHKLSVKEYAVYRFDIIPRSHGHEGPVTSSNYIAVGPAAAVPAVFPAGEKYVAQNATSGAGWLYDAEKEAYTIGGPTSSAHDMLITPYVDIDKAYAYRLTVSAALGEGTVPARLTLKAGEKLDLSSFKAESMSSPQVSGKVKADYESYIYLPESGIYHLGLAADGVNADAALSVYSVSISRGPDAGAPAMVEDLSVAGWQGGQRKADITFRTPAKDIAGKELSALSEVIIRRNGEQIGRISGKPGVVLTFTDTDVPYSGRTEYSVTAVNAKGEGIPATASAYIGEDIPGAPENIVISETAEGLEISWDAPSAGMNGAHVTTDLLRYIIVRSDNVVVADHVSETRFVDSSDFGIRQKYVAYAICAVSEAGNGAFAYSPMFLVGAAYDLPFEEEFTNGGLDYPFWAQEPNGGGDFKLSGGSGHDGSSGLAIFKPTEPGGSNSLVSGKIRMDESTTPALAYCFDATCGAATSLEVSVRLPDGSSTIIDEVDFATLKGLSGWRRRMVDLRGFMDYPYLRIAFRITSHDGSTGSAIDQIVVSDAFANDVEAKLMVPSVMEYNQNALAYVEVINCGYEPLTEDSYTIALFKDDTKVTTVSGTKSDAFETRGYEIEFTSDIFDDTFVMYARVEYPADQNKQNNTTEEIRVRVNQSTLPVPEALTGNVDNDDMVTLSWEAPDNGKFTAVVVDDDVENYSPFAISGIGEWTMIDVDGNRTFGISDGVGGFHAYPNAIDPKSFIVFNAPESGVEIYSINGTPTKWAPHSGDQMFVSFQASGSSSDDWMISPRLSGKAQTISFWTRSVDVSAYGAETYEVLWSAGGMETSDFILVDNGQCTAPDKWTKVSYDLPEGAVYFAIRATSMGGFALMVDDISYSPADYNGMKVKGYNVYCNKVRQNSEPIAACEFRNRIFADASEYAVSAVYDAGESRPTESLRLVSSGTANVGMAGVITVCALDRSIVVKNAAGENLEIFAPDGTLYFADANIAEHASVAAARGIYIVRVGDVTVKVIVK